ncbi:M16 family metallopeptidase [Rariglobus hedericola]|uniref:Insulinase family protein n=1 Tax=Rariglobus hedericola TaxID=2597822 RepID=A0A556QSN3_9BACT|nr:pitrilysin family protein [Rariglobus hedericola]TSJ79642.1 insulinase family protein [Rariglobus hedericola]
MITPRLFLCALLLPVLAARAADTPAPVTAEGFKYVKTLGGISEYTLDANGLQVLVLPDHSAPVVTFMVTYRVGSRNEVTGTTGATHLLEHLMFKGTPNFNREKGNSVDQLLERVGAVYNATTWLDRTNYYANLGKDHLDAYVAIESDRMRNLWLRDSDRKPEMTVVRNEFEIGENNPIQALDKEISAAAYVAHPYHHSTIGWRSDIENVPIEKLKQFYDTFYWPDNATVTVIGDVDPAAALAIVKKHYGAIPKSPSPIPQVYTEEPAQSGPRRVTVKRAGQLGVVGIAYKTPAARHADTPALQVLGSILSSGKNSRLYRALTDKNLTTGVSVDTGFFHDPSLATIYASLAPSAQHAEVEKIALAEVATLKKDGVTQAEVDSAISQLIASSAYARDGAFAIASNLNEFISSGDWTLYVTIDEAIKKVTAADVKRVANEYFDEDQSTTGWFIPVLPPEAAAQ